MNKTNIDILTKDVKEYEYATGVLNDHDFKFDIFGGNSMSFGIKCNKTLANGNYISACFTKALIEKRFEIKECAAKIAEKEGENSAAILKVKLQELLNELEEEYGNDDNGI